ncbi:hypothetical protein [Rhodococcus aetherivorans]|uniref:hypothetical protein n=1 Tax=Rhodococcus aetherivorans TaxID=191292 RepID=UPI00163A2D7C|nr:hypothetical protein [Rhodococcus aetherivorans]MBC2589113.1 hypothetical protein [Rhodococcus aetherivorans]
MDLRGLGRSDRGQGDEHSLAPVQEGQDIALAAGFSIPPLPDLGETLAGKGVVDVDAIPFRARAELVVR